MNLLIVKQFIPVVLSNVNDFFSFTISQHKIYIQ